MSKPDRMPRRAWESPFMRKAMRPVGPQLFLACTHVYQAAARFQMVVENPQERKIVIGDKVYAFGDIPMNRGMFAALDFLGEQRREFGPAVTSRLMALGVMFEIARADPRFSEFFKEEKSDGSVMVAECFLCACGEAKFKERTMDLDVEDVLAISKRLAALDPPIA